MWKTENKVWINKYARKQAKSFALINVISSYSFLFKKKNKKKIKL